MAFDLLNFAYTVGTIDGAQEVTPGVAQTGFRDFSNISSSNTTFIVLAQGSKRAYVTATKVGAIFQLTTFHDGTNGEGSTVTFDEGTITVFTDLGWQHVVHNDPDGNAVNAEGVLRTFSPETLAALKTKPLPASGKTIAYLREIAAGTKDGAFYEWDRDEMAAGDDFNYVVSSLSATGRWVRQSPIIGVPALAADGDAYNGSLYAVSDDLRHKRSDGSVKKVFQGENNHQGEYTTFAQWQAVASTQWKANDTFVFRGITEENDLAGQRLTFKWDASSTNTDALGVTHLRPDDISGSNAGRAVLTEPSAMSKFADSDATPDMSGGRFHRCADTVPAAITALDGMVDLQPHWIFPGAQDQVFTHGASLVCPGGQDFTLSTTDSPIMAVSDNGVVSIISGGVSSADLNTAIALLPNAQAATQIDISSGTATPARETHVLGAESGTSDTLTDIDASAFVSGSSGKLVIAAGDTITVVETGNITIAGGATTLSLSAGDILSWHRNEAGTGVVVYKAGAGGGGLSVFRPEDYGAVGDGDGSNGGTNDLTAFIAMGTAYDSAGGGVIQLDPNKIYRVDFTGAEGQWLDIEDADGVILDYNGSTIDYSGYVFAGDTSFAPVIIRGGRNVVIKNGRFLCDVPSSRLNYPTRGLISHYVVENSSDVGGENLLVENISQIGGRNHVFVQSTAFENQEAAKWRGVSMVNCHIDRVGYGVACAQSGDGLRVSGMTCDQPGRSVIIYGIDDWEIGVESYDNSFDNLLLICFNGSVSATSITNTDITNGHLRCVNHLPPTAQPGSLLALSYQAKTAAAACAMRTITFDLDVIYDPTYPYNALVTTQKTLDDVTDSTSRPYTFENITFRGKIDTNNAVTSLPDQWTMFTEGGNAWGANERVANIAFRNLAILGDADFNMTINCAALVGGMIFENFETDGDVIFQDTSSMTGAIVYDNFKTATQDYVRAVTTSALTYYIDKDGIEFHEVTNATTVGKEITYRAGKNPGANNDVILRTKHNGRSSAGTVRTFAQMDSRIKTNTDGAEVGGFDLSVMLAGTFSLAHRLIDGYACGVGASLLGDGVGNFADSVALNGTKRAFADGGWRYPAYTSAEIQDATNAVNTTDKAQGKTVWDSTNFRLVVASGSGTTSVWYAADGATTYTPS